MQEPLRETIRKVILVLLEASRKTLFIENEYIKSKTNFASEVIIGVLRQLAEKELIILEAGGVIVPSRINLVEEALRYGIPVDKASLYLDWRDFEQLSSRYLEAHGYRVYRGIRLPPPRGFEIDVLGLGPRYTIVVDCKHWSPGYSKKWKLKKAAQEHLERTQRLAKRLWLVARRYGEELRRAKTLIPVIVTLTDPGLRYHEGVLISPITLFNNLLLNIDVVVEELGVGIKTEL